MYVCKRKALIINLDKGKLEGSQPRVMYSRTGTCIRWPSHVKLMLANSCQQTQNWCVCERYDMLQTVGKKLERLETSSISRQQFANMLLCRSHTPI